MHGFCMAMGGSSQEIGQILLSCIDMTYRWPKPSNSMTMMPMTCDVMADKYTTACTKRSINIQTRHEARGSMV